MEGKEKKPPIEIKKTVVEEEEKGPGSLDYVGEHERRPKKPSTGMNWVQVLLSCVISLVLAVAIIFQLAPSKSNFDVLKANQDELVNRISSVASDLGGETTRINNIVNAQGDYAKKTELAGYAKAADAVSIAKVKEIYESRVATLEAEVTALKARVTELETPTGDGDGLTGEGLVYELEVRHRIEDSGDYGMELIISNNSGEELTDLVAIITLRPKDDVRVGEGLTGIWTESRPYLDWDTVVTDRGTDPVVTKRVEFESEWFDMEVGETLELDLELTLEYIGDDWCRWSVDVYVEED